MSQKYMNRSEFARYCQVTPTAITRAVKDKKVTVSTNGMIDANGTKNRAYMQHQVDRKNRTAKGRSEGRLYSKRAPEGRGRVKNLDPRGVSEDDTGDDPCGDEGTHDTDPRLFLQPQASDRAFEEARAEVDYAIEKMRSATALNKARLAAMVRSTIRKDFVDQVISLIGTSISDHLITLGDRISPDLAAMAGSTEASVVRRIKQALDDDISAALHEMQRVVADRYQTALEAEKC